MKLTEEMRKEWKLLRTAYNYGSRDRRISVEEFKRIWMLAAGIGKLAEEDHYGKPIEVRDDVR